MSPTYVKVDGRHGRGVRWTALCIHCKGAHRARICKRLQKDLEAKTADSWPLPLPTYAELATSEKARLDAMPCDYCGEPDHPVVRCRAVGKAVSAQALPATYHVPVGLCCEYCAHFGAYEPGHPITACRLLLEHAAEGVVAVDFVAPEHLVIKTAQGPPVYRVFESRPDHTCEYCSVAGHRACVCDELRRHIGARCVRASFRLKTRTGGCEACARHLLDFASHSPKWCPFMGPDDDDQPTRATGKRPSAGHAMKTTKKAKA
ncbi:hypothetical protein SPRG_03090 [Saprolegnia parasitica CBS 223.65]|uniref:Uncharacterized protein n=1 Tax=Saprolegnia parasitica (strain CBS 223.65) TaxID=695850 RepID=A0A067CME6_SAPPC|nr:hypothetical protein SPRG_03090 [Saprolegnia parasitica CBS 223.65]KDO31874.1 hypothetical protein SPRG_03090 [Saprolegnia parasitica CBS 223.65]|eukprot:XP_012197074.1 hypothetical protein SPRG_03090 [Saprolegnia parasitica CBS 223.65]